MTIGLLKLFLFIHQSNSLKTKRMYLHSIKARLRNNFNVGVSQIDGEDKWQRCTLVVVGVDKNRNHMNSMLSEIVNFVERSNIVQLLDYEMELI
ncbi:MAG: DUF503 domain-containing protein [Candidatus Omnitrophota bacterium]|nr:MAG: DUF503 domain-containing protein [Candidatus Omnitrophota bacterium]